MNDLKSLFESLNFNNVTTYIQSGNVIFSSDLENIDEIKLLISNEIEKVFQFKIPVLVLTINSLKEIILNNPFLNDKEEKYIHFTFLSGLPNLENKQILETKKSEGEELVISNNIVYIYCPNGYGKTKLTNNFIENKLNTVATTRNYKTTHELLKIAESI